jgi:hypothetical protein
MAGYQWNRWFRAFVGLVSKATANRFAVGNKTTGRINRP